MARKTVLIFLGCIFSGFVLFGQSARELFDLGNEAYKSGQYQEALFQYENALKQPEGENSAALHYNLANCYYKTNQLGLSILHYEKTLKLNPDREEAEYNLELANARIVDKVEASPSAEFYAKWEATLSAFGADNFAIASLGLLLLSVFGFYFFVTGSSVSAKKSGFSFFVIFLVLFATTCYLSFLTHDMQKGESEAIVLKAKVDVKTEPNTSANTAFVMHEGAKVEINDQLDSWVEIKLLNGNMGWVPSASLGII